MMEDKRRQTTGPGCLPIPPDLSPSLYPALISRLPRSCSPTPLAALLLAGLLLILCACSPTTSLPTPSTLSITGSADMRPLLQDLGRAFTQQHPEVSLKILSSDTIAGLSALSEGKASVVAASWLPEDHPGDWVITPIAWDGIAVIVHPDNPLEGLTILQLRQLFAGWAFHWQDVGAPASNKNRTSSIQILSREAGSGTRAVFESIVMGNERVTLTALVMPDSQAVVDYVADHVQAIGYVSMGLVDKRVKVIRVEGQYPSPQSVVDGSYHLARPFYLITRGEPTGPSKLFIDFALSPTGQAIVGNHYGRVR
ncbi:MAG: phosphate ABC transporter substrate-binding protein [Anaerolineae bacterium]|nr:phosphate ABC transporter substrate-binding protein [Anaerolineae bacterium]